MGSVYPPPPASGAPAMPVGRGPEYPRPIRTRAAQLQVTKTGCPWPGRVPLRHKARAASAPLEERWRTLPYWQSTAPPLSKRHAKAQVQSGY